MASAQSGSSEQLTITHPERVVYAGPVITKAQVVDYYRRVARWMLPDLRHRPLSLVRCPGGAEGECFFQKHHKATLGNRVGAVPLRQKNGEDNYIYVEDLPGLLQLVQMNTLEFHTWGSSIEAPESPDRLVFDLDPGDGVAWADVLAAARTIRARLARQGLQSFVRMSGGKGLHVVCPINSGPSWDQAKDFCGTFAAVLAQEDPARYVANMSKAKRPGKIYVDWLRNGRGATSVCSWSLRARKNATVAMPLRWEELGSVTGPDHFTMARALRRASRLRTDPWQPMYALAQDLPRPGDSTSEAGAAAKQKGTAEAVPR